MRLVTNVSSVLQNKYFFSAQTVRKNRKDSDDSYQVAIWEHNKPKKHKLKRIEKKKNGTKLI